MFRRQQFARVNPRNVVPSRHTLFIRGLPGTTDVTKVKDFFSAETNTKCSVDFFSLSEDEKRISVAIRFKSHDIAKEILSKYNNKHLMGFPVELTWFKDLKRAREKMLEEQRKSGGRSFQRQGFRGNFHGNDRRSTGISPNGYVDGDRRARAGSSSSGGGAGNSGRPRYSNSRSRSFTGSSSRTGSISRSHSGSPQLRRSYQQGAGDNSRLDARGFTDNKQTGSFSGRQPPRNQSYRSVSRSSSSSRSSRGAQTRTDSAQKPHVGRFQHEAMSPVNLNSTSRKGRASLEDTIPDYSFTNVPAPDMDGGSSLVSGLIQLKRRQEPDAPESQPTRRKRRTSSSSDLSVPLDAAANTGRHRLAQNRLSPLSPTLGASKTSRASNQPEIEGQHDFTKRKRQKQVSESPSSLSPPIIRGSYVGSSRQSITSDKPVIVRGARSAANKQRLEDDSEQSRLPDFEDDKLYEAGGWPQSSRRAAERSRKPQRQMGDSVAGDSSFSDLEEFSGRRKVARGAESTNDQENDANKAVIEPPDDPVELIRLRKEALSQDYKRDCEAFTTVVRTLISKDAELEGRLMPMLKEILHERGQRCIEEMRTFIAEHQADLEKTEGSDTLGS